MLTALKRVRVWLLLTLTHHAALPILKRVRRPNPFPYTVEDLANMPVGSVGRDFADFLRQKSIQLLEDYERHDMKHLLLGFDTTEEGEICLQAFMLGNGRVSFPVLVTVAFGLCLAPEYWQRMKQAYTEGKKCHPVHHWDWFALIPQNTAEVRQRIFLEAH